MRTINYGIRLMIILAPTLLAYWGIAALLHQEMQLAALITLLVITPCIERLWALLEWMSPILGTVNMKEQERTQKRIIEHQLSHSVRYGSRLVIAAIREKKRMSSHVVEHNLRKTDIVLRDASGYLLVLMPETTIKQAYSAFQHLTTILPMRDAVVMDENMLRGVIHKQGIDINRDMRNVSPQHLRQICTNMLDEKLTSIPIPEEESDDPIIYPLFDPEEMLEIDYETKTTIRL